MRSIGREGKRGELAALEPKSAAQPLPTHSFSSLSLSSLLGYRRSTRTRTLPTPLQLSPPCRAGMEVVKVA